MRSPYQSQTVLAILTILTLTVLLSCGGEEPRQSTGEPLAAYQIQSGDITFTGTYENLGGILPGTRDIESPWFTSHNLLIGRVQTKVRLRLQGLEENWEWPFTITAKAVDLAIGETGSVYLEATPLGADPSYRSGAYEVIEVKFRLQGYTLFWGWETIDESGWHELQSQGLADRTNSAAPLSGSLTVPEDYCLSVSILDLLLSWLTDIEAIIPTGLDPLSVHACLYHVIRGEPMEAGLMPGQGTSLLSTDDISLGGGPASFSLIPSAKDCSFYFGPDSEYWYTPVIDPYAKLQVKTFGGTTLWDSGSVKLTTGEGERAFAYHPWPPPDEPDYSGTMPDAIRFDFTAAAGVTGVSPVNGPMAGGTEITLTGGGFLDVTMVHFDDIGLGPGEFTIVSDSEILVTSPAWGNDSEPYTLNISVSTPNGNSPYRDHNRFRYLPRPVVTGIEPNLGLASGGTRVTVTGSGFDTVEAVSFGTNPSPLFTVINSDTVEALSPPGGGDAEVSVTTWCEEEGPLESTRATTCGTSDPAEEFFTYTALVVLSEEAPRALEMSGAASLVSGGIALVNSQAPDALYASGSCSLWSDPGLFLTGGYYLQGNIQCVPMPGHADSPTPDPLGAMDMPETAVMPQQAGNLRLMHGETELYPGVYRGGIAMGGNALATLAPGIYALEGGLTMSGTSSLEGADGAILYILPSEGSDDCGEVSFTGNTALSLGTSRDEGLEGISIIVDRSCKSFGKEEAILVSGNTRVTAAGALYAPSALLDAGPVGELSIGSVVVDRLRMRGSAELSAGTWDDSSADGN